MKAIIQKAELRRIDGIWKKHKPQGLGFSDTDVVILRLKTEEGKEFDEDFYCRLKADGTLGRSMTRASDKRQQNLLQFIKKYISLDQKYNVRDNLHAWKGKEVDIGKLGGSCGIKL